MKLDEIFLNESQIQQELEKIKQYYNKVKTSLSQEATIQYNRFIGHLNDALKNDPSSVTEIIAQLKRSIGFQY